MYCTRAYKIFFAVRPASHTSITQAQPEGCPAVWEWHARSRRRPACGAGGPGSWHSHRPGRQQWMARLPAPAPHVPQVSPSSAGACYSARWAAQAPSGARRAQALRRSRRLCACPVACWCRVHGSCAAQHTVRMGAVAHMRTC